MTTSFIRLSTLLAVFCISASAARAGDAKRDESDPCESVKPAAAGGPVPHDDEKLVVRWLGTTNYEISYRGQVLLFDTYFDRGPRNRPIGLLSAQVTPRTPSFSATAISIT